MSIFTATLLLAAAMLPADRDPPPPRRFVSEGSTLPGFELEATTGKSVAASALRGRPGIVVFVRPGQATSLTALRDIEKLRSDLEGEFSAIAIASGRVAIEKITALARDAKYTGALLLDPDRRVYSAYGVIAVPSVAVFDGRLKVVFSHAGYGVGTLPAVAGPIEKLLGVVPRAQRAGTSPRIELARRLIRARDYDGARRILDAEIESAPSPGAFAALGDLLRLSGKPEKALEILDAARRSFPSSKGLEIGAARVLVALDRHAEAEKTLRAAILAFPGSWEAHETMGELREKLGDKEGALIEYKRALELLKRER